MIIIINQIIYFCFASFTVIRLVDNSVLIIKFGLFPNLYSDLVTVSKEDPRHCAD